jgi:DNA polymerase delta subunit 1
MFHCFQNERYLLTGWKDFVIVIDQYILTGYNIINFDLPYLIKNKKMMF